MIFLCIKPMSALVLNYRSFHQLFTFRKLVLLELNWCHFHWEYPVYEYLTVTENPPNFLKIPVFESSLMFHHPFHGDLNNSIEDHFCICVFNFLFLSGGFFCNTFSQGGSDVVCPDVKNNVWNFPHTQQGSRCPQFCVMPSLFLACRQLFSCTSLRTNSFSTASSFQWEPLFARYFLILGLVPITQSDISDWRCLN